MVPVILLTGFLGSGKTTLLNRLFRERPPGRGRFAIVVNELGSVGIDADLLPEGATRQVELPGGCICCQLVGELESTLAELLDAAPDLETIIIETTGVADPMPISWTLAGDRLGSRIRLAAVVTVVDPREHETSRPLTPSVDAQVAYADLLVLSKLDEVRPSDELLAGLRERNALAPLLAEMPDTVAARLWSYLDDPDPQRARGAPVDRPGAHGHAHVHGPEAGETTGFDTVAVAADEVYDLEELTAALEELPAGVVRIKGIVRAIDSERGATQPGLFVVHRVGARVSTEPHEGKAPTRIVAIGRDLDSDRLGACLASAVVPSDAVPVHSRAD